MKSQGTFPTITNSGADEGKTIEGTGFKWVGGEYDTRLARVFDFHAVGEKEEAEYRVALDSLKLLPSLVPEKTDLYVESALGRDFPIVFEEVIDPERAHIIYEIGFAGTPGESHRDNGVVCVKVETMRTRPSGEEVPFGYKVYGDGVCTLQNGYGQN